MGRDRQNKLDPPFLPGHNVGVQAFRVDDYSACRLANFARHAMRTRYNHGYCTPNQAVLKPFLRSKLSMGVSPPIAPLNQRKTMMSATAHVPCVSPEKGVSPGSPRKKAAKPEHRLAATIDVDGRELQTITEWWATKPAGVQSWPDERGLWLTSRIYDPFTQESYLSSSSTLAEVPPTLVN